MYTDGVTYMDPKLSVESEHTTISTIKAKPFQFVYLSVSVQNYTGYFAGSGDNLSYKIVCVSHVDYRLHLVG